MYDLPGDSIGPLDLAGVPLLLVIDEVLVAGFGRGELVKNGVLGPPGDGHQLAHGHATRDFRHGWQPPLGVPRELSAVPGSRRPASGPHTRGTRWLRIFSSCPHALMPSCPHPSSLIPHPSPTPSPPCCRAANVDPWFRGQAWSLRAR